MTFQEIGAREGESTVVANMGRLSARLGEVATARAQYEQALALGREIGDRRREGASLFELGCLEADYIHQRDVAKAKAYLEQALAISREVGDRKVEEFDLDWLGSLAFHFQQDMAAAEHYYQQALTLSREIGPRFLEGRSLIFLADAALYRGAHPVAKEYLEQALVLSQEIGRRNMEGHSLGYLGMVAVNQGDVDTARELFEQAIALFLDINKKNSWCSRERGVLALEADDLDLAERLCLQAEAFHKEQNQPYYQVKDWAVLAKVKFAQGEQDRARAYAERVRGYLQENPWLVGGNVRGNPIRTFRFTWEVWAALGKTDTADEVLALAAALMQDYLDKNPAPAAQEMYLRQSHHAVLWKAWTEKTMG